jgi:hypothetical protein
MPARFITARIVASSVIYFLSRALDHLEQCVCLGDGIRRQQAAVAALALEASIVEDYRFGKRLGSLDEVRDGHHAAAIM